MKHLLAIVSILCLSLSSCYEDHSNTSIKELSPIIIDFGTPQINKEYSVFMFDTLRITPQIYQKNKPDSKLSYEWKLSGNTIAPEVIGTDMQLKAYITAPRQATKYDVTLTVTDEHTGVKEFMIFNLMVESSFSEGLIVADTKDGINSDLSLIVSRQFNSNVAKNERRIFRNAYSQTNKELIPGLVRGVQTAFRGTNRTLTVLTEKTIIRADYYDFAKIPSECNEGIFVIPPKEMDAIAIEAAPMMEIMNVNGTLYPRSTQNNVRKYSYFMYPTVKPDYKISHLFFPESHKGFAFDAKNNRILFVFSSSCFAPLTQIEGAFDVNNLADYEPLLIGEADPDIIMLARNKKKDTYECLVLLKTPGQNTNVTNFGKAIIDFSSATEIRSAKTFALNKKERTIYYATDKKLYATAMGNINSTVQYEAKAGEIITDITVWRDAAGRISQEYIHEEVPEGSVELSSMNRMMLITIYNENTKEGKIVAIPIVTLGIGGLEQNPKFQIEFGGFNRILKIGKQSK